MRKFTYVFVISSVLTAALILVARAGAFNYPNIDVCACSAKLTTGGILSVVFEVKNRSISWLGIPVEISPRSLPWTSGQHSELRLVTRSGIIVEPQFHAFGTYLEELQPLIVYGAERRRGEIKWLLTPNSRESVQKEKVLLIAGSVVVIDTGGRERPIMFGPLVVCVAVATDTPAK